jgi:hypothetical protein
MMQHAEMLEFNFEQLYEIVKFSYTNIQICNFACEY